MWKHLAENTVLTWTAGQCLLWRQRHSGDGSRVSPGFRQQIPETLNFPIRYPNPELIRTNPQVCYLVICLQGELLLIKHSGLIGKTHPDLPKEQAPGMSSPHPCCPMPPHALQPPESFVSSCCKPSTEEGTHLCGTSGKAALAA